MQSEDTYAPCVSAEWRSGYGVFDAKHTPAWLRQQIALTK